MVIPGEWSGVAVLDSVAEGENVVECVLCGVRGVVDELGEAYVVQAVKEVLGIQVGGVVQVEIEVSEEYVIFGVDAEGGYEVGDLVAEVGSRT